MLKRSIQCLFLGLVVVLGGCMVANAVVDPYTNLRFEALGNVNPDGTARPSPVVVRVYELSSGETFRSAGFFDLYDEPRAVLERDLLSMSELVVRPGLVQMHPMQLNRKTRYIGIVAAFQNIEEAEWKLIIDARPRAYQTMNIELDELTIKRVFN